MGFASGACANDHRGASTMPRFASTPRHLSGALVLIGLTQSLACANKVTTIALDQPFTVSAQTPAAPLADLPSVPQPPPPPRVSLVGDVLTPDEPLSFDVAGTLKLGEHEDILAELAKWLAANEDVTELRVEVVIVGSGSKRALAKQSTAAAKQVVDALVREGIAAERLLGVGLGPAPDGVQRVTLRVSQRAESEMTIAPTD